MVLPGIKFLCKQQKKLFTNFFEWKIQVNMFYKLLKLKKLAKRC